MLEFLNSMFSWLLEIDPLVLIALSALLLSVVVAYQNHRHNKLSVKPNVDLHRNSQVIPYCLTIKNTGVGPAIIESITIEAKGRNFKIDSREGMKEFMARNHVASSHIIEPETYLSPGDSIDIATFGLLPSNRLIDKMSLTIKWRSIYNEKFGHTFTGRKV